MMIVSFCNKAYNYYIGICFFMDKFQERDKYEGV